MGAPKAWRDVVIAATDIVERAMGQQFEIGYLDDEPPGRWWASARLTNGDRVIVGQDYEGQNLYPWEAADALVGKLMHGAKCVGCDERVWPVTEFNTRHVEVDGELVPQKPPRRWCKWRRHGDHWEGDCGRGAR